MLTTGTGVDVPSDKPVTWPSGPLAAAPDMLTDLPLVPESIMSIISLLGDLSSVKGCVSLCYVAATTGDRRAPCCMIDVCILQRYTYPPLTISPTTGEPLSVLTCQKEQCIMRLEGL